METAKKRRRKIKATSMKVYGAWAPVNAIWPESRHVSIVFFRSEADSGPYTRLSFFFLFHAPPRLALLASHKLSIRRYFSLYES